MILREILFLYSCFYPKTNVLIKKKKNRDNKEKSKRINQINRLINKI